MQRTILIIGYVFFLLINVIFLPSIASQHSSYDKDYADLKETLSAAPEKVIKKANTLLANDYAYTTHQLLNIYEMKFSSFLYTNNYQAAEMLLDEIKVIVNNNLSPVSQWKLNYMQAVMHINLEQSNKAVEHFLKAYKFIKPHSQYTYERANTENALGYIYVQLAFYKEAIPYLTDSLKFNKDNNKLIRLTYSYNNLGEAYFGLKEYKKAEELHLKALKIRLEKKLTFHSSYSYHNLGVIYKAQGRVKASEESLLKAITIRKESNFLKGLLESQLELAKLYSESGQAVVGDKLLLEIIATAIKEDKFTTLSEAYKLQTKVYQSNKQFESAFNALSNYQKTLDKIQLKINDAELAGYITKLSTVTKDLNILSLNKANEINKIKVKSIAQRSNLIITFSLIIVAVLAIFLWLLHQKRKKIQRVNQSLSVTLEHLKVTQKKLIESEKMSALTILVSGIAHRINTPLGIGITALSHLDYSVKNFSELVKKDQVKKSTFIKFFIELEQSCALAFNNMNNVSELVNHFKLLSTQLGDDKKERFNVLQLLAKESDILLLDINDDKPVITIHGDEVNLTGYPSALRKVIGHLIKNSIDHAFTEQNNPVIDIAVCIKERKGQVEIIYQDNGKGIDEKLVTKVFDPFYTSKMGGRNIGLGLSVVYNLIVQLMQGNIVCDVSAQNTTSFKITLPIQLSDD